MVSQVPSVKPTSLTEVLAKLPESHSLSFMEYKSKLNIELLKQPLTRENYIEKFHHLLCWEEQEHDRILKLRYKVCVM